MGGEVIGIVGGGRVGRGGVCRRGGEGIVGARRVRGRGGWERHCRRGGGGGALQEEGRSVKETVVRGTGRGKCWGSQEGKV